jgi:hypothetical protein
MNEMGAERRVPGGFTFADADATALELAAMTDRMRTLPVPREPLLRRLLGLLNGGQVLKPEMPHPYAPLREWPGSCWCDQGEDAPVHLRARGGAR